MSLKNRAASEVSKSSHLGAFVVGVVFAVGLGVSGMTQPRKVIGFLDLFGAWDPSLLFVMGGAVGVHFITYRWIRRRKSPLFEKDWKVPTKSDITPALVVGSLIFGVGWGLAGYCPGPAVVSLASLQAKPFVFVTSMIAGMIAFRFIDAKARFRK